MDKHSNKEFIYIKVVLEMNQKGGCRGIVIHTIGKYRVVRLKDKSRTSNINNNIDFPMFGSEKCYISIISVHLMRFIYNYFQSFT